MGIELVIKSLMNRDAEQQRMIKDLSERLEQKENDIEDLRQRLMFAEAEIARLEDDVEYYKELAEGKGE